MTTSACSDPSAGWNAHLKYHNKFHCYRPRSEGDNVLGSVRPSVCLSVLSRPNRLTFDLDIWHGGRPWRRLGWDCRSRSKVKVKCLKSCFTSLLPCFKVKVKGRGQGQMLRSRVKVNIRGSALPSAAKSHRSHYQFKVFVCVSVISGRILIITRMRSIGF